ncbi:MAG: flagellar biosynthetic protein FliR [Tateyamaria sp.]|jgi:flagellar biosynthetic protein FliR|nr:flagellar biosynthetic protein FliR [Tateyamaria sp.]MDG1183484.1 flagellar biosynthetic protein FliR [Tateyamaria sp.]MDG1336653.1 flagellar biosynthetic protein FliR [Tateyamaria sp.]MDG2056830.1 flagellar biosynthetic protein FliR [Tateyamaria sp.]
MNAANELLTLLEAQLWIGFVVFLRVGATVSLLPGFGEQTVPMRIKLVIALAFTLIVAPAVSSVPPAASPGSIATLAMTEILSGALIGIGIRLFILALQTAGSIAAQSTSLSQILGGAAIEPLPAMGYVLTIGAIALAVMAGLHIKAAHLLIHSYVLLPMGFFAGGNDVADWGLMQVAHAFELAFVLAAPFVLMSVLYNLALGVINKAMPQLMVAFVGAPVITLGGLFLLFLAAPTMLTVWMSGLDQFMANPFGSTR